MLQIRDLHYSIGDRPLLSGIDWMIRPGDHTALVGPNGVGKTTLLRILNGELESASGSLIKPRNYRIGYLPQEEVAVPGVTVLQTVLDGQQEITLLEKQMEDLHHLLEGDRDQAEKDEILEQLGHLEHRYKALDGYHIEIVTKRILSGLGFREADYGRSLSELSGGWRMRVYLALLLVRQPDLLLLDEPTNHLDLPSLEWLEQYLASFPGSIVIVSHDRFFIDRVSREIAELDRGKIVRYPGNYHFYEAQKKEKEELLLKKWKEQKLEREKQERFINRFRYKNTKAKQVQSRIRQLEKLEPVEEPLSVGPGPLQFDLEVGVTSYNDVLTIKDMSFRYDTPWVLRNIELNIYRGDRVCLVGPNGAGKTTLTRLIVQQLEPVEGEMQLGQRTTIGYYAQHQVETLNLEATVYDEVASTVATSLVPRIRDILGIFQFSGSDVYKKTGVLSGGEKARVSLAKILISPANFLIMDEPTNHLDKGAREALEAALSGYKGTLILISHDRYFLDKLVNRVVEIRDGRLIEYDGNYSYYLQKRDTQAVQDREQQKELGGVRSSLVDGGDSDQQPGGKKTKEQKRLEAQARQAVSKERNLLQKQVDQLEEQIDRLENQKQQLEEQMALPDTYENGQLAVKLQKEHARVSKDLTECTGLWENALTRLEELLESLDEVAG